MRPLRRERQKSSSEGRLESKSEAQWSIWRSHSAAWYLLEAETHRKESEEKNEICYSRERTASLSFFFHFF